MPVAESHPPTGRRTWPERLAIGASIAAAVASFGAAAGLTIGYGVLRSRDVVEIRNPAEQAVIVGSPTEGAAAGPEAGAPPITPGPDDTVPAADATTPPTFPAADPDAKNFLITGADNGACIDPDSPYAAAFGNRDGMGERSDTIMMFRVDPETSRVAVLSFPRDLYVEIADAGNRSRINSAYRRDEPQRLIDTIYQNFDIATDHFIQVDFCAFKTLVDAVGGVTVPFDFPARDPNTGLNVAAAGCFTFEGEHALAYVRSRQYEYEDPPGSGTWREDGTSDLGRISRQQDFLRRVLASVLDKGPLNPSVAGGLIESAQNYIVTDNELSPAKLLEFAGVLNNIEPGGIPTYQIESSDRTVNGAEILEPELEGENMQEILALFSGETSLAEAPEQLFETTAPSAPPSTYAPASVDDATGSTDATGEPDGAGPPVGDDDATPTATVETTATTVVDVPGAPEENILGIVPPRDVTC